MKTVELITKFSEFAAQIETEGASISIGTDPARDTRIVIDEDGYFILREAASWKRVRTSVNVSKVTELRFTDPDNETEGFYVICADDTGFLIDCDEDEIYYCENGAPSGWGNAVEHFRRFPAVQPDAEPEAE